MSVFTLEAVFAKKGDALLLHYGPWDAPKCVLIDGGPSGVYRQFLKPRLNRLREELELESDEPIPFARYNGRYPTRPGFITIVEV